MDLHLQNQTALIVGGASGIGLATANAFAAEGARVALWDRNEAVHEAARQLSGDRREAASAFVVDVTDSAAVNKALEATLERFGQIDHLVHAAAIGSGKFGFPFTNLQPADWPKVLAVNIMGMVNIAHAIGPHMVSRKAGTMVFLASVAGQIGSQTDPPYSAAKAANINFAQCLAKDLAPHGARVNTVCPGMVQTPLNRSVWQAWNDQAKPEDRLTYEEWSDRKIRAVVPLGKWQTPEAIADMILFLSSDRAAHVTGQTINVDGGFVMHW
ncbi:MAG TPA: SDR family oxidoreductase [Tepidisphaeraceae bacterium]|jgi:2-hydroxycyclohexanecarboxyl-CoA dehydrogenase|nr:SDR family oxidoreductase [Tepidisphaeraceae bacterium]